MTSQATCNDSTVHPHCSFCSPSWFVSSLIKRITLLMNCCSSANTCWLNCVGIFFNYNLSQFVCKSTNNCTARHASVRWTSSVRCVHHSLRWQLLFPLNQMQIVPAIGAKYRSHLLISDGLSCKNMRCFFPLLHLLLMKLHTITLCPFICIRATICNMHRYFSFYLLWLSRSMVDDDDLLPKNAARAEPSSPSLFLLSPGTLICLHSLACKSHWTLCISPGGWTKIYRCSKCTVNKIWSASSSQIPLMVWDKCSCNMGRTVPRWVKSLDGAGKKKKKKKKKDTL